MHKYTYLNELIYGSLYIVTKLIYLIHVWGGAREGGSVVSANITFFSSHDLRYRFLENANSD